MELNCYSWLLQSGAACRLIMSNPQLMSGITKGNFLNIWIPGLHLVWESGAEDQGSLCQVIALGSLGFGKPLTCSPSPCWPSNIWRHFKKLTGKQKEKMNSMKSCTHLFINIIISMNFLTIFSMPFKIFLNCKFNVNLSSSFYMNSARMLHALFRVEEAAPSMSHSSATILVFLLEDEQVWTSRNLSEWWIELPPGHSSLFARSW